MTDKAKLPLFVTRIFIFLFLAPWVLMRFTKPEAAQGIAAKYYKISSLPDIAVTVTGVLFAILLVAFLFGFKKRITYLLVLLIHAIGTVFTIPNLIPGTDNFQILFMAALPTIGAMWLLYTLRDHDTIMSIDK